MGNPLSPVVANLYMEFFEQQVLQTAPCKPETWWRYVDDVFCIWPHGEVELQKFLIHLNSYCKDIQFTMEQENNNTLAFLDVLVTRKEDLSCGHAVYRKPTNTGRYFHHNSNHHPAQKNSLVNSLVHRAIKNCDEDSLEKERQNVFNSLRSNGYPSSQISKCWSQQSSKIKVKREDTSNLTTENNNELLNNETTIKEDKIWTCLPFIKGVIDKIARILMQGNIKTIFKPTVKIEQMLNNPKDKRPPLSNPGIYGVPCSCGKEYIGLTRRSINIRISEHERSVRLGHPKSSSIADHALSTGHTIRFEDTRSLRTENNVGILRNLEAI